MAYFRGLLVLNFVFMTKTVQKYTRNTRTAMAIDLHAIKSITRGVYLCKSLEQVSFLTQSEAPQASTEWEMG